MLSSICTPSGTERHRAEAAHMDSYFDLVEFNAEFAPPHGRLHEGKLVG